MRIASACSPYERTEQCLRSWNRPLSVESAAMLDRMCPPIPASDVADAISHCRSAASDRYSRKNGRPAPWRTRHMAWIWCIAKIIAVDAQAWPSVAHRSATSVTVPLFVAWLILGLRSPRLQYVFRVLFVIPLVLPTVVILLIWQFIYDANFGVLNQVITALHVRTPQAWLGDPKLALYAVMFIGLPWVDGFALLVFTAGLQSIPNELLEAAAIDGAGRWRRLWHIQLPLVIGQIKLILILNMIWTIQNFTSIFILTQGGPGTATMVPGLVLYKAAFESERMGYACAIGALMFVLMLVLTIINMKYVRSRTDYEPVRQGV